MYAIYREVDSKFLHSADDPVKLRMSSEQEILKGLEASSIRDIQDRKQPCLFLAIFGTSQVESTPFSFRRLT